MKTMGDTPQITLWSLNTPELLLALSVALILGLCALILHDRPENSAEVHVQSAGTNAAAPQACRLNLNTATPTELEMLPGITASRARAIVTERTKRGAFRSTLELSEVPGITPALARRLEPLVTAK